MFVELYKSGGHWAPRNSEKIIKIVANEREKNDFIAGAEKTINTTYYNDFKKHVINNWQNYIPYTEEEKKAYKEEQAYILRIYERDFENIIALWFYLCSLFK